MHAVDMMERRDPPWRTIVDETVVGATIDRQVVFSRLGDPHAVNESGDGEAGPCDYWCYEFGCGLWVLATSHRNAYFDLRSNSFEPHHVLQHFPWVAEFAHRAGVLDAAHRRGIPAWFVPRTYRLYRVDDLGNRCDLRSEVPEYESRCVIADFERGAHQQGYFRELS